MEIFGIGIHVIVAIFFAIHAMRSGRNMYWLFILFVFPLLGSVVYFFVEYLPGSRVNRGFNRGFDKASSVALGLVDPSRELREARDAYELSPSVQNRVRLAKALLARGEAHESIAHFDACLSGPFARDPELLFAAASAKLQDGQVAQALELAQNLREVASPTSAERASLLLARAYAANGDSASAKAEFQAAVARHNSVETKAQYGIWAAEAKQMDIARNMLDDIGRDERHWTPHARSFNKPLLQQLEKAIRANES
ncbi:MAG: PLDc N-terminal domain-containing protein [Burkholderiaceae bacterium]|nr:PLDc N-terminal domain-containing protein [Burkholderiaceae bacterium]